MAKPFSALPNILENRRKQFLTGVNVIARNAAIAAGATAVDNTRVDTGLARSNWIASVGSPSGGTIPPYAPGKKLGTNETGNATGAKFQHASTIAAWDSVRGQVLFIVNNVRYIGLLNFGGRNISPGNMLDLARQAWVNSIKTAKVILR